MEERRLAAIMFSDICSFSKIMGANEQLALSFVEMHKQCLQSGTDIHGGRIIKELGDGLLVEFSSAVNAVKCAMEVQKAVANYNAENDDEHQFLLRIGIHVGDVVVAGDDILGDGVNIASRIEPLAEPGGICISRDIFDMVKSKISIETVHLGPKELKNISRQVGIYKVLMDAVDDESADTHTKSNAPMIKMIAGLVISMVLLAFVSNFLKGYIKKRSDRRAARVEADSPEQQAKKTIKQRQAKFIRALLDGNRETAFSCINPLIIERANNDKLWMRMKVLAGIFKAAKGSSDNLKVKFIHLAEDGQSADLVMQILRKPTGSETEEWKDMKPTSWKLIDGQWYIDLAPPANSGKMRPDGGFRRKRPGGGQRPRNW